MKRRIGVAGDGAWGRALAFVARSAGHDTTVWSRRAPNLEGLLRSDAIILAVPAQVCRDVLSAIAPALSGGRPLIIAAKGIEQGSGFFMHELAVEILPEARVMVLSGPSFAADVVKGLPTAVTLAAPTLAEAGDWGEVLSVPSFRIYGSDDVLGVEIGGALKNVLAIACGISDGQKLGDSARAALTTRGFAEMMRFGKKLGAKAETLTGLSGLGDLMLTSASPLSRNYAFGRAVGEGHSPAAAIAGARGVVEGAATAKIAAALAIRHGVDMPIVAAVKAIIEDGVKPEIEIARLLARPAGTEIR